MELCSAVAQRAVPRGAAPGRRGAADRASRSAARSRPRTAPGVLHRDIKPSNILTHRVRSPGALRLRHRRDAQRGGCAKTTRSASRSRGRRPRCCSTRPRAPSASEVWSLGATVYSLLAGRSPFEIPGGANGSSDLMSRIDRAKPQPIGRPDVPTSLEQLLAAHDVAPSPSTARRARSSSSASCSRSRPSSACRRPPSRSPWTTGRSATVADLEDRTRVRPLAMAGAAPPTPRIAAAPTGIDRRLHPARHRAGGEPAQQQALRSADPARRGRASGC